jgi:hypothetical protein
MTGKLRLSRLCQEISLTLLLKAALLAVIWAVWFSIPEDHALDDAKVAEQILSRQFPSQQLQKEHNHDAVSRTR